jgi:hypothetical protein
MKKITVKETLEIHGLDSDITQLMLDSIVPACCDEGCEVEPDGTCEHGNPSILIELGIM